MKAVINNFEIRQKPWDRVRERKRILEVREEL